MIIGIIGGMSSGKTLLMTREGFHDYRKGMRIFSNYKLAYPHEIITTDKILEYAQQKTELADVAILFDEFYLYADSRLSGSKKSLLYSYFILQTSKRNIKLYYSSQNFHAIDKRIRDNTHILITVHPMLLNPKTRRLRPYYSSQRKLEKSKIRRFYILAEYLARMGTGTKYARKLFKMDKIFSMYNTEEIIRFDPVDLEKKNKKKK